MGSGTIRMCDLFGVGVALLEEVSLWGRGFEVSYAQALPSVGSSPLLLPANQGIQLSAPSPVPCLSARCHVSLHDNNELNL